MATNQYFSKGSRQEQILYEDLIVESLKMYGQDVNYMPRETVNIDEIFKDDATSRFERAYQIEMYIENTEGFDGEGDLFTKFGVEIRDQATFVVSRRRWLSEIAPYESVDKVTYRPREGDLIHLPLSNSIFQIMRVEDEAPFYQLKNLPVFRMTCELFEYTGEDFDTNISAIDEVENFAYQWVLSLDSAGLSDSATWTRGETITQYGDETYNMTAELVDFDGVNNKLYLAHVASTDSDYHVFSTSRIVTGSISGKAATPTLVEELQALQPTSQNEEFEEFQTDFVDFSESNPFGDP